MRICDSLQYISSSQGVGKIVPGGRRALRPEREMSVIASARNCVSTDAGHRPKESGFAHGCASGRKTEVFLLHSWWEHGERCCLVCPCLARGRRNRRSD